MKKFVVSGVLLTTLLAPSAAVLAKNLDTDRAPSNTRSQVDKEVKDEDSIFDKLAAAVSDDEKPDAEEKHSFWKFWEDQDDDEGKSRLSTQHDIKG